MHKSMQCGWKMGAGNFRKLKMKRTRMASGSGKGRGGGRNWVGTEHCRNMTHTRIFYGPQIWKKAGGRGARQITMTSLWAHARKVQPKANQTEPNRTELNRKASKPSGGPTTASISQTLIINNLQAINQWDAATNNPTTQPTNKQWQRQRVSNKLHHEK